MTKAEALKEFREHVLPYVRARYERDGRINRIALWEAWNDWTDALCKDGRITTRQYERWDNPYSRSM